MKRLLTIFGILFAVLTVGLGIKLVTHEALPEVVVIPLEEETPVAIVEPVAEPAPAESPVAIAEPAPAEVPVAVAESTPTETPVAIVEPAPTDAPVVIAEPVAESTPTETPVAIAEPAPTDAPVVIAEPVAESTPTETPVAIAEPAPTDAPVVIAEPVAESTPTETPVAIAEPAPVAPVVVAAPLAQSSTESTDMASPQGNACPPRDASCAPCNPPIKKEVKPCPPKVCKPCRKPPACCWKFNPCNPKGCSDMNGGGFIIAADFLYWSSQNHGFSYAYEIESTNTGIGKVLRLSTVWDPGFRVGLGWNTGYNFWDLLLNYTWYQNHTSQTNTSTFGYINTWPVSTSATAEFNTVTATSNLQINMGDLELGRLIYLTKTVALRPHAGLKGGTLDQKFTDQFTGRLSGSNSELKFDGKNNFWGIGPRLGLDGEWHLSWGFSILSKLSGALLYGNTKAESHSTHQPTGTTTFGTYRQYTDEFNQLVPNLQLALGFQWQTCFASEQMFYKMSLSWEANYWWDQFNLPVGMSSTAPLPTVGNQALSTQGLTYKMEWDF